MGKRSSENDQGWLYYALMDETTPRLILVHGPSPGLNFLLQQEQSSIGRSANNDLVIADPEVSRKHAQVVRQGDNFAVEDLGSTNGSFLNGQRISSLTVLQPGDTLDLGDTIRLRYEIGASQPVRETRPPAQAAAQPSTPPVLGDPPMSGLLIEPAAPGSMTYESAFGREPAFRPKSSRQRPWMTIGCGSLIALALLCVGTLLVLDAYQQGRLLYCGPLRPLFEFLFGPLGFAPLC